MIATLWIFLATSRKGQTITFYSAGDVRKFWTSSN